MAFVTGISRSSAVLGLLSMIVSPVAATAQMTAPAPASVRPSEMAPSPMGVPARATTTSVPAAGAPQTPDAGYVLGSGDVVEVSVVGREDFRTRVRVQTDGTIQLPLIGTLTAAGKTPLQFREEIGKALRAGGYFANPAVNVDVATYASRYVTVLGEVGQPGLVPIDRGYRVSEILARVGGVRESGADHLTLRRVTGEEQQLAVVALATGGPNEDPIVNPGDKLFVAMAKMFYIYGQVAAPGSYRLDTDMSLRKALARGGGLTASGSEKRVRVYRDGKEIKKFDLNAAISPGDVVVVGERFF